MPDTSFLVVTTADRARSLAGRPSNVAVETDLAVRRDATAARARARGRAARPREQLLGRDDRAPPGDGARKAGRRHADGGDRDGLRARGRGERAARRPGDAAGFGRTLAERARDESPGARALGVRARATVEASLTWERYVGRLEDLLEAARG